ncbi:MAG: DNA polymerase IV [Candidatus Heimdallarchaeota archaeon]|nr:MAG: DNA polymerase IV [Candidatus Heimdallarchaeota archaeon]
MDWSHVIIHVDLDAFFAAVHIKNHPFLRGYPVIIGANPQKGNGRGVVSTCSYEARRFGLHSAMPISQAYKLCPHGVYICSGTPISFSHYHEESEKVMTILLKYTDIFQNAGVDEAYLDVTKVWSDYGSTPKSIAETIQTEIQNQLSLPVSLGVAETKSIAKIASDLGKPNGITLVHNSELDRIIYNLPARKIVGIGKKTEQQLQKKGIVTIGDIASLSREKAYLLMGDHGLYLRKVALGNNYRSVGYSHNGRKSIGSERTFGKDQNDWDFIENTVDQIVSRLSGRLKKNNLLTRTISIKIRFQGFITYTRSFSFQNFLSDEKTIFKTAIKLLEEFKSSSKKVRLIGVRVTSLKSKEGQLILTPFLASSN